jgi:inorganic pyrophosphatase
MKLDFVFKDLVFPFNYGFIPNTLGGDGDALDAMVLSSAPIKSGETVVCKIVGMVETVDRGEEDNKIITVPLLDKLASQYQDIDDLPFDTLPKWTEFYLELARQKKKVIKIIGLKNKKEAIEKIEKSFIDK